MTRVGMGASEKAPKNNKEVEKLKADKLELEKVNAELKANEEKIRALQDTLIKENEGLKAKLEKNSK